MTDIDSVARELSGFSVLGVMRIKNESEWIRQSIESQLPVCDKVLVLDDHSTDDTRDIVRMFGARTALVQSPFEGVNEGRDKRFLLDVAVRAQPGWVLWIDGDEVLERTAPDVLRGEFARSQFSSLSFQVLYFWNYLDVYRSDGCYESFWRRSAFRVRGQDAGAFHFPSAGGEADLHNGGNCPQGILGANASSRARIKHYGYLRPEERHRKFEWYNRIDPNNEAEDRYRHIIETPGARHAPGPTVLTEWREP